MDFIFSLMLISLTILFLLIYRVKCEEDQIKIDVQNNIDQDASNLTLIEDSTKYPFMAAVFSGGDLISSGILITPKLVLTNAIEFIVSGSDFKSQRVSVRMGSNDSFNGYIEYLVTWIYLHPFLYTSLSEVYDVSILSLSEKAENDKISPIHSLASYSDILSSSVGNLEDRTRCVFLGYGTKQYNYSGDTAYLRGEEMSIIDHNTCQMHLDTNKRKWTVVPEYQICAQAKGKTGCYHEIGSPLICNDKVYGLMIDNDQECRYNSPTIFLRIDMHRTFIDMTTNCPDLCI